MSDTEKMMAVIKQKCPNSWHLHQELEDVCSAAKDYYGGRGHVQFDLSGFDIYGKLVAKFFDLLPPRVRFWHKEEHEIEGKRAG
jgi:trehalose/maltose hydrolase-like predicted phosphorylase